MPSLCPVWRRDEILIRYSYHKCFSVVKKAPIFRESLSWESALRGGSDLVRDVGVISAYCREPHLSAEGLARSTKVPGERHNKTHNGDSGDL